MAKAIKTVSSIPLLENQHVFFRAAMSARVIGFAATVLAGIVCYDASRLPVDADPRHFAGDVIVAAMFLVPGLLYLLLSAFVTRRKKWAVSGTFVLAMLDMIILGIMFVSSWGTPKGEIVCAISGTFVVAIAVLTTFLRRCFDSIKTVSL